MPLWGLCGRRRAPEAEPGKLPSFEVALPARHADARPGSRPFPPCAALLLGGAFQRAPETAQLP